MRTIVWLFFAVIQAVCTSAQAQPMPPFDVYGALPEISMVTVSPNGNLVAYRSHSRGQNRIYVLDLDKDEVIAGANVNGINPRRLQFVSDTDLVMVSSDYLTYGRNIGREVSRAYNFRIESQEVNYLLRGERLSRPQVGLGSVIGVSEDKNILFMPGYVNNGRAVSTYGIFKVFLETGNERVYKRGTQYATGWMLDADGEAFIREEYNEKSNIHSVWRHDGTDETLLYEERVGIRRYNPVGLTADRESVVMLSDPYNVESNDHVLLSVHDGSTRTRIFEDAETEISRVLFDENQIVMGVEYAGFVPKYDFFDADLSRRVASIQDNLPGVSARLTSVSTDKRTLVFHVTGGWSVGRYFVFKDGVDKPIAIGSERSQISRDQIAEVRIEEYKARDGLLIPALVTATRQVFEKGDAPLVILPHGGPGAHNRFGFDWQAQFLASQGYVVLQPQVRGSSGFGVAHQRAGEGEWGGKVQTDLDDGAYYLASRGLIDLDRACILGTGHGGYAALAAAAFSPVDYKCVVAVGGISDLWEMLDLDRKDYGKHHWVVEYWNKQFGERADEKYIRSISPLHFAARFTAPVLLVHGEDDAIIPLRQSKIMRKALRKAKKDVTFIELDDEDHWLSQAETRIEYLKNVAEFLNEHLR